MNFLSKHIDTILVLGFLAVCFWILNEKMNTFSKDILIVKYVNSNSEMAPIDKLTTFK